VRITKRPLPQDDPTQRKPDITRAREWLGWEPVVQLAEGLDKTVEYFREKLRLGLAPSSTRTSGEIVQRGVG
jgi:UDP-glucuronate decarboxylase